VRNLGIASPHDFFTDHVDLRPTLMLLTGLKDDYIKLENAIDSWTTERDALAAQRPAASQAAHSLRSGASCARLFLRRGARRLRRVTARLFHAYPTLAVRGWGA